MKTVVEKKYAGSSRARHGKYFYKISVNLPTSTPSIFLMAIALFQCLPLQARDYFNPSALEMGAGNKLEYDLEGFSDSGGQLPGTYMTDIYLNNAQLDTRNVTFVMVNGSLQPEFTVAQLSAMGVKVDAFPNLQLLPVDQVVIDLAHYIPDASSRLNFGQQRIDISIPQAALKNEARGYVEPALWDSGLPAALINYSFSGSNNRYDRRPGTDDHYYLNLRSGLNLGDWRLRNYSTYNDNDGVTRWDNVNTYLQRDVVPLKGQLTLGDISTPSDIFESFLFRGAQLASDDNMFPDSLRGFAPVVRGIAQSNAQVTVRQNGYIIYQSYVPPGAFTINDLYPTSSSGDLDVTITEADGTERHLIQPFSAVPVMVREGRIKYSLAGGEYRTTNTGALMPKFGQGTLIYGLPADTTLYGGVLLADHYTSQVGGVGHGFGHWGSLSVDVTQANTELQSGIKSSGQSYRFQYAKDIEATNTTFTLAGYRYSTKGFYDFQEANEIGSFSRDDMWRESYNKRSKAQLNINQSLEKYGNFYINAYQQDYWQRNGVERNVSLGYNLGYQDVNYGLNYSYNESPGRSGSDQQLSFSVQMPLDKLWPSSWASYNLATSRKGATTQQVGLSGTALTDNNLNYNVQQTYGNKGERASGNVSTNYLGTYGEAQVGYNYTADSEQINYGVKGGVVGHPYGVTFSQQQGETMALVRAPGARGAKVENNTGVYTDWRGYAVVPYVSTYRRNRIAFDTETFGDDVDMDTSTQTVIPTRGALVLADFQTRVGSRVLMTLHLGNQDVPFGAIVVVEQAAGLPENSAIVGTNGQVYLSGVSKKGQLRVKWGSRGDQQCWANFNLPEAESSASVLTLTESCNKEPQKL